MIGKIALLSLLTISLGLTSAYASMPNPVDSLHFDSSDDTNFKLKGSITITSQENPSLKLNGIEDYLIINSNLPEKLKDFSISVWVNPDYKIGAPSTLSIVSESAAFDLSINNDQIDRNIVAFSIYDGIKWKQVQSTSEIKETWTHIAATYSGETITIFVNGIKENYQKIDGDYSLTHQYGVSTQNSFDYIYSKSDVLVGGFSPLARDSVSIKNHFSGLIDDVRLYNDVILPEQVSIISEKGRQFSPQPIIQDVQSAPKVDGIVNEYGFMADPSNQNDQKIESVASEGFKVRKKISTTEKSPIINNAQSDSLTDNESSKNVQSDENLNDSSTASSTTNDSEEVSSTASSTTNDSEEVSSTDNINFSAGIGNTSEICHIPSGNLNDAFTVIIFSSSVNLHLAHGDYLGACS